ncbi:MAG: C25 family cysteine peptidase [Bacteroidales bacterium]|nr:C25 family cysteine peptidase [Bacteroidales bacterium]
MKKFTLSCLFVLFSAFIFAGNIEYTYYFDAPSIKQSGNYQVLAFSNTFLTGRTGEPSLPYQPVSLLLPPGEEAISVTYRFGDETALEGYFTICPQQPARPLSMGSDGIFHKNNEIYGSHDPYPSIPWGEYSTHFLNGHSFLLASFTPVNYIPSTGQVSFFRNITICVETRATERATKAMLNISNNYNVNNRIRQIAQNTSMMDAYPEKSTRDGEYQVLIITPQLFESYFQELADLNLVRGLKTEIITTETISAEGTGQDMQAKIRNFIISEYQAHSIEHVLLGGDAEIIPYRGFYCFVQSSSSYEDSNIPADLYYSALDGNWNTDGDGYWAEIGEDDLLPDVSVARFPVSTGMQLQRLINKTVRYQDDPVTGELRDPLMAGEELWTDPLTYGEDYLELLIGYRDDNGYETNGIPGNYNFTDLYDSDNGWGGYDLINEINQGKSFVHHSGHANQTYVMRLGMQDITNSNFSGANGTDHNYTLIYTHGCLCGAFDENDCIGEAMVCIDNFAVAGAFNSRYGWFNEGQTEGPSAHLHREFVDALYNDKECRIGSAHMISKIETSVWVNAPGQWEEGALRWCFYCCNIFGDPALGIWTDEPIGIQTTYPEEVYPGTTSVPVTVTSNGEPVEGLMCVIMADGTMLGCCPTNVSGQAVISVPGGFAGVESAEIVVSGYNCLPAYYPLDIMVGLDEPGMDLTGLSIQPNPFSDHARLAFNLENEEQVRIGFYIPSGQMIDEIVVSGKEGMNEISLDTSGWPDGVILARVVTGSRVVRTQLVHTGN